MRELNCNEVVKVSGGYGDNALFNLIEAAVCSVGGAVLGSWTLAIMGGRGASSSDVIGIGGGFTALIGMIGGALLGAAVGAIGGPYAGYENGKVIAAELLLDVMRGKPGS